MRFSQCIAVTWLALAYAVTLAHAEKRVALVAGNDRYANLAANEQLQKAVNDAHAVGKALEQLGFEVMSVENAGRLALVDKLDAFARRLSSGDTAFFFFSGHGVAIGGVNYILPADVPNVEADQETRLARMALSEHDIVSDLQARGVRIAVVVLDACRTNPFARSGSRGVGGERGLAPPPQVRGVFSLYAASSGQAARDRLSDDDRNPNSVFSRVLVPALSRPGLDLTALAFDVREEVARVARSAGYVQEPSYYDGTIGGRVYLAGAPSGREQSVAPVVSDAERTWGIVQNTTSVAVLDDFIRQFGATPIYGPLARTRREELAKEPDRSRFAAAIDPARSPAPLTAAQERALKPRDAFRECENCPEMVVVPAGVFTMGSPKNEKDRLDNEGPQHVVTIGKPFAVGKFHVTRDQFAAFVQATGYQTGTKCLGNTWRNPGFAQEGTHSVICVSWDDARAYIDWLARRTGKPYRLLSEAEFEYAARGRTSPGEYPRFWFGNDEKELCRHGNYEDQKPGVPCSDGHSRTSPGGHYAPNAFGLYDMAGNAWNWTADCYHSTYNGAPSDGSAWITSCETDHVVRGGSWAAEPKYLRAAHRDGDTGVYTSSGFRVARSLVP